MGISQDAWRKLQRLALDGKGTVKSPISVGFDFSGSCTDPYIVTLSHKGSPDALTRWLNASKAERKRIANSKAGKALLKYFPDAKICNKGVSNVEIPPPTFNSGYADLLLRCRKCPNCLKARAALWASRARIEVALSSRTWFMTFTVNPHNRALYKARASQRSGCAIEQLSEKDRFKALYSEMSKDFTKYMKRLRKSCGGKLRFIMVAEAHKDGFPHLHALIHEQCYNVTKRVLQSNWRHIGFTSATLCNEQSVFYVTKYLSKAALARVRASLHYGRPAA
jgi:hypothetical protein